MPTNNENLIAKRINKSYPSDWKVVKLGSILERIKRPVDIIPNQEYQEIGIRSHGKGIFYKEPVKGSDLGNKSVFWIQEDCLIINIVFAWEQAVAMTTVNEKGMIASHRFPMWQAKGEVDLEYLYNLLLTPLGKHLLELASPGGAGRNKTLGQDEFNRITICIPGKIEEQKIIVQILEAWNRAIDLKKQLIAEKKRQNNWLMNVLLTGKKRLKGFADKWEINKLGYLGCLTKGKGVSNLDLVSEGIPFISYGEIYTTHNIAVKQYRNFINSKGCEECYRIYKGDIIFAGSGESVLEIGKAVAYLNEDEAYVGGDTIILRQNIHDSLFLAYLLNSSMVVKQLSTLGQGQSIIHIYPAQLANVVLSLPPLQEQIAIAEVLSNADLEVELITKQLAELESQKKALIQLLLTGKVRVNAQEVS